MSAVHEVGLALDVLDLAETAARRDHARAIRSIGLRVGAVSGVDAQALRFAFEVAREGTLAAGATLEIETPPAVARCDRCGLEFEVHGVAALACCPRCQGFSHTLFGGDELEVAYLEVL